MEDRLGDLAGVGLGDGVGLDGGQGRLDCLDLLDHVDDLRVGAGCPQALGQLPDPGTRLGQHHGRPGGRVAGERCVFRDRHE